MKSKTLTVKAKNPAVPVPLEGPRVKLDLEGNRINLIRDEPVTVPNTIYYRRSIRDGTLVEVEASARVPKKRKAEAPKGDE